LYLAKAEYYFMDNNFSPFAGLGLGLSNIVRPEVLINDVVVLEEKKKVNFALSPRVGFVAGGFHMEFIYNIAGKTPKIENEPGRRYNFWSLSLGYRYVLEE